MSIDRFSPVSVRIVAPGAISRLDRSNVTMKSSGT
jgi:hypothetical protein